MFKGALFLAAALAVALCVSAAPPSLEENHPPHALSKRGLFSSCFPCCGKAPPTCGSSRGSVHAAPPSDSPKQSGKGKGGASAFGRLPSIRTAGGAGAAGPNRKPLKDITNTHPRH